MVVLKPEENSHKLSDINELVDESLTEMSTAEADIGD